jgi:lon-related putative ATP-dependent protease
MEIAATDNAGQRRASPSAAPAWAVGSHKERTSAMVSELTVMSLRRVCDPEALDCGTTEELTPIEAIIGQPRAIKALQFGLGIREQGFNIYVAGHTGTGKTTAVNRFLRELAKDRPIPSDWCYLNNFRDPYRPKTLRLPSGKARELQAGVRALVEGAQHAIRRAFESEEYAAKREETMKSFARQSDELIAKINSKAQQEGFLIQATPIGLMIIPVRDGKPLSDDEFMALSEQEQEEIAQKRDQLQSELGAAMRRAKNLEKDAHTAVGELDQQVALFAISHLFDDLLERYREESAVVGHLEAVREDMLEHLDQFRRDPDEPNLSQAALPFALAGARRATFRDYQVNVLVDNSELEGAPVVMELNPTYNNLFGRIEQEAQFGALVTDFTMIREGALHRANGGYLVLPVQEVLRNPFAWDGLKRALENQEIAIEDAGDRLGFISTKSLRPEPVTLDLKVILIGDPGLYYLLHAVEDDFSELFKVKADFDVEMDRTDSSIRDFASFVCTVCEEEELKHLDGAALAALVEHGSRLAGDQAKISTRFGQIADVIREASFYATQDGSEYVAPAHVKQAIDERYYRSNLLEQRISEMIQRGTIMIDVTGEKVGQVNGLSVIDLGDIVFGQPSRITAAIGLGRDGVVNIEREAELSGPIHTKGVLILAGYLTEKYAQDSPLSLSAHLVFEQSYSGVEGDSASSTELYATLSALAGLPIKQGIGVTGSVNQKGEVQAIGGVNEKIEGFFEVCKAYSLTGEQGVMIPAANASNLMLKEEVVEAVREGRFHVWPVKTIDEGIEVLTGVPAGARQPDGTFEAGTVNARVDSRLRELAEKMQDFGRAGEDEE